MDRLKAWAVDLGRQRWLLGATALALLAIAWVAAQQLGVILLKVTLVTLFGALGYYIDRAAFPYARPHELLEAGRTPSFDAAQLRRAVIMAAAMLAGALGL